MKPKLNNTLTTLRRFVLNRLHDVSGVSGQGIVADGVMFPSGKVAIDWRRHSGVGIFDSVEAFLTVHGHRTEDGQLLSQVIWLDDLCTPVPH